MAKPFNLTARLQLEGPDGLADVVRKIKSGLGNIKVNINIGIDNSVNARIKGIVSSLEQLKSTLSSTKLQSSAAAQGMNQFTNTTTKSTNAVKQQAKAVKETNESITETSGGFKRLSSDVEEFGRVSGLAIRRFAGFSIATTVIFGFIGSIRKGITEAIAFERQLVRVGQATGNTIGELDPLVNKITQLSTSLGVSSSELAGVAQVLSQAGLSARDTKVALEAIAKTDLSPTFRNMTETTEGAIAAMRQFKIGVNDLEEALGSINAVSAAFAVESEDLIAAIQRTGGVFATASEGIGTPISQLQQFISIMTSVRQTTRESAESIATGLRTIFTRLQRTSTIAALKELGVELRDTDGEFVGIFESFNRLSKAFQNTSGRSQLFTDITEELGGFRQIGKTIPAIRQFSVALEAFKVAQEGGGSLTKDVETAQQSLAVQIAKTREQFLAFIRDLTRTDTFKFIANSVLVFTNALITLGKTVKPLLPILATFAAFKLAKTLISFGRGFRLGLRGKLDDLEAAQEASAKGAPATSLQSINTNTSTIKENSATVKLGTGVENNLIAAVRANIVALNANTAAISGKSIVGAVSRSKGRSGGIAGGGRIRRQGGSGRIEKLPTRLKPRGFAAPVRISAGPNKSAGAVRNFGAVHLLPQDVRSQISGSFPLTEVGSGKNVSGQVRNELGQNVRFNLNSVSIPGKTGELFEKKIHDSVIGLANQGAQDITTKLGAQFQPGEFDRQFLKTINIDNIVGNIFEGALVAAGKPYDAIRAEAANAPFDFPKGIGSQLAGLYGDPSLASIPVDAKRSFNKDSVASVIRKIRDQIRLESKEQLAVQQGRVSITGTPSDKELGIIQRIATGKVKAGGAALLEKFGFTGNGRNKTEVTAFAKQLAALRGLTFAGGGSGQGIPALLEPGELVVGPSGTQQLGLSTLREANAGNASLLNGVGDISKVPGSGSGDTFPTTLPEGSFVIRRDVADQVGGLFDNVRRFAKGGPVRRHFIDGGGASTVGDTVDGVPAGALAQINKALAAMGQLAVQSKELIFVQGKLAEAATMGTQGFNHVIESIQHLRQVVDQTVASVGTVGTGSGFGPGNFTESAAARHLKQLAEAGPLLSPPVSRNQLEIFQDNIIQDLNSKGFNIAGKSQRSFPGFEEAPTKAQGVLPFADPAVIAKEDAQNAVLAEAKEQEIQGLVASRKANFKNATITENQTKFLAAYETQLRAGNNSQRSLNIATLQLQKNIQATSIVTKGIGSKIGDLFKGGKIGSQLGFGLFASLPLLQGAIGTSTPERAGTGAGLAGGISGAFLGSQVGSILGPLGTGLGTIIGGATGALVAFTSATQEATQAEREKAREENRQSAARVAEDFAKTLEELTRTGKTTGTTQSGGDLADIKRELFKDLNAAVDARNEAIQEETDSVFNPEDLFRVFTRGAEDILSGGLSSKARFGEQAVGLSEDRQKLLREAATAIQENIGPIGKLIEDTINAVGDTGGDVEKVITDVQKQFGLTRNDILDRIASQSKGGASALVSDSQAVRNQARQAAQAKIDEAKINAETIKSQEELARVAVESVKQIDLLALSMSRFGQLATQVADSVGGPQNNFVKGVLDAQSGQIGGVSGFNAFSRPDIATRDQLQFGVQQIERFTGRNELTDKMSQLADVQEELTRDLPLIFQRNIVKGETAGQALNKQQGILDNFEEQFGGRLPQEVFDGIKRNITSFFTTRQNEDVRDVTQGLDIEKFSDPVIKAFFESGQALIEATFSIKNAFVESSNEYIKAQLTSAQKQNEIIGIQQSVQDKISELSGINVSSSQIGARGLANVNRLARQGGLQGNLSADAIADRIIGLSDEQGSLQQQLEFAGPEDIRPLTDALARNTLNISSLNASLDEQIQSSQQLVSAIEKEIAEIQQRKQAGVNIVELLANARTDPQAAVELQKRVQSGLGLLQGGPIAPGGLGGGVGLLREIAQLFPQEQRLGIEERINQAQLDILGDGFKNSPLGRILQDSVLAPGGTGAEQALFGDLIRASDSQVEALQAQQKISLGIAGILQNQIGVKLDLQLDELRKLGAKVGVDGGFAAGGFVGGTYKGNRDTELARLQPGEFVVRRNVAQANAGLLESLNRGGASFRRGGFVNRVDQDLMGGNRTRRLAGPEILALRRAGYTNEQIRGFNNTFTQNQARSLRDPNRLNQPNLSDVRQGGAELLRGGVSVEGVGAFAQIDRNRADARKVRDQIRGGRGAAAGAAARQQQTDREAILAKARRVYGADVVDRLGPDFFTSQSGRSLLSRFNKGGIGTDRMLAAVTPGEFIMNAGATSRNKAFLQTLNSGKIPRFQNGGLVGGGSSSSSSVGFGMDKTAVAAMNNLGAALRNLGNLAQVANNLNLAAQQFTNLNIPTRIEVQVAPVQVNVIHNGAEIFAQLEPRFAQMVAGQVSTALAKSINPVTGETSSRFI